MCLLSVFMCIHMHGYLCVWDVFVCCYESDFVFVSVFMSAYMCVHMGLLLCVHACDYVYLLCVHVLVCKG